MPPVRSEAGTPSDASMSSDTTHVARPTITRSMRAGYPTTTPLGSPGRVKSMVVPLETKQQMIENLQTEITMRARKLRAQCAQQVQQLRTRMERRVTRIPAAVRKTKMGDLIAQYEAPSTGHDPEGAEPANGIVTQPVQQHSLPILEDDPITSMAEEQDRQPQKRGAKRTSDVMELDVDKENAVHMEDLPNPKKRAKTTTTKRNPAANRAASRAKVQPSQVLSPKSFNSRAMPHSPLRPPAPPRSNMPVTTAASAPSGMVQKTKVTRAPTGRNTANATVKMTAKQNTPHATQPSASRRNAVAESNNNNNNKRIVSHSSDASDVTVVTKAKTGGRKIAGKGKTMGVNAAAASSAAIGKKPSQVKTDKAAATAPSGRVLRKRP